MPTWLIWTLGLGIPLAAASVPIIIHLINLTRYRKVDWAAMEFLLAAYRRTRRRMQLENLIMLLLRVLAVILIAAALFPMGCQAIKDWTDDTLGVTRGTITSEAPLHLVMVLDNSASMAYRQENLTSFDRAQQYAVSVVDNLRANRDRVSLIRLSDVYVPPAHGGLPLTEDDATESRRRRIAQMASLNLDAARREISATRTAPIETNMLAAMREAARLIETTPESDAVAMVVISDFVRAGWRRLMSGGPAHTDFMSVMDRVQIRTKGSGTTPLFYDVSFDSPSNIAVLNVRVDERIIGNGMDARVFVDVGYFASDPRAERRVVRLRYRIDGGPERPFGTPLDLGPGEVRDSVLFTLPARELALKPDEMRTGAARNIEVFTEEPDALPADNSRHLVIHVVPGVPVLVVNGHPHPSVDQDETFYLETALGISSSRIEGERGDEPEVRITPNQVVSIRPQQLAAMENFFDYRLVILANVPQVSESVARKLEEFVEAGFGLMFFDGPQVDYHRYNELLYRDGRGLLPARLGAARGSDDAVNAARYGLTFGNEDHPVIRLFAESTETRAIVTQWQSIFNWRELKLPEGAEVDARRPVDALLNLNVGGDDAPIMLERPFGRGRVVYVATTASERWNGMWRETAGLPLFLYLETAAYLTSNEARYSNLAIGEVYRRILRVTDVAPQYTVRDPSGTVAELAPMADGNLQLLEYAGTAQPGVFTLTAYESAGDAQARPRRWQERFAVNMSANESDVTRVRGEDGTAGTALQEALPEVSLIFRRAAEDLGGAGELMGDDDGKLWLWLIAAGVVFLMLETIWSGVISKPED